MIALVPLGDIPAYIPSFLKGRLESVFSQEVTMLERQSIPQEAFDEERSQYNASSLIDYIENKLAGVKADKVLAVTDQDIYDSQLNFIFGMARSLGGKYGIVSTKRLSPSFYGLGHIETIFKNRAAKEAVHEMGHLYGLVHCAQSDCLMRFAGSINEVDYKKGEFCQNCQKKLNK